MVRRRNAHHLALEDLDAVIFDMDGVVTDTARVHAVAWKALFDDFLRDRAAASGTSFRPFDADEDYRRYVDGMARADGVRRFLASRGMALAEGTPEDGPEVESVHGVGARKNQHFLQSLQREGIAVFETTLDLIRALRAAGLGVAVISASENCKAILERAGIAGLFDVRVDGIDCRREGIAGKPAPDIFVAAARALDVPAKRAAVVEDAIAGVRAGRAGDFALVVAVDRTGAPDALRQAGADLVVADLSELDLAAPPAPAADARLPSALAEARAIGAKAAGRRLAVFLDYDGTLTPIVDRPEQARLSADMRDAVARLAGVCTVAVISGRGLEDVRRLVDLDSVYFSGSHGFEIAGPEGLRRRYPEGERFLPMIRQATAMLHDRLDGIAGALVEEKRYTVAAHYRLVAASARAAFDRAITETLKDFPDLRPTAGKAVWEIRPNVDWHKGKAVLWLIEELGLDDPSVLPVYIGDDVTDEDAFRVLADRGLGIVVEGGRADTAAAYRLRDPGEVRRFLGRLTRLASRGGG